MAVVEPQPKIRAHGTVRVTLPAKVAYDPAALKKSIGELMERLGCPRCFSGADCFFTHERAFVLDPKGVVVGGSTFGPSPEPWLTAHSPAVTASLAPGARFNIDKVFKAVDKVIDIIGACPCHSGIDVLYRNEIRVIGIDEQLQGHQFGG